MKKQALLYGISGLLAGALLSGVIVANSTDDSITRKDSNIDTSMTMHEMSSMLEGKSGDDFDKAFLSGMIEHHQGAIDMANQAKQHAKHEEIKKMAADIASTQAKEIEQMQTWQSAWGYTAATHSHDTPDTPHAHDTDHAH